MCEHIANDLFLEMVAFSPYLATTEAVVVFLVH